MRLTQIEYSQFPNAKHEWRLEGCTLGDINLIVGKNANGKTMLYNILTNLVKLLRGERIGFGTGDWTLHFDDDGDSLIYFLKLVEKKVYEERLTINGKDKMTRGTNGVGKIWAEKINELLDFQLSDSQLACVARRDSIQHPFFESLAQWAASFRSYSFGTDMEKSAYSEEQPAQSKRKENRFIVASEGLATFDPSNPLHLVYKKGVDMYDGNKDKKGTSKKVFSRQLLSDMKTIGYDVKKIDLQPMTRFIAQQALGLHVSENDIGYTTNQYEMSQGMFRALSLLIHLNVALLEKKASCIVIDDIGEGLDYERSTELIRLLIKKAEQSSVQLIMTTNDRFVMNNVPLEYWSVIERQPHKSVIYNYRNSKEVFDSFEMTGLNNFDFFSGKFYKPSSNQLQSA